MAPLHGKRSPATTDGLGDPDPWEGLKALVRYRLLLASLALPVGLQIGPDAAGRSPWVLVWSLIAVGVASALFALGVRLRRGPRFQHYVQQAFDVLLVTALSGWTGGQGSQFSMFYLLVIVSGGFLAGVPGGLATAALSCAGFLLLPGLAAQVAPQFGGTVAVEPVTSPAWFVTFLAVVGGLTGFLGQRAYATRQRLAETRRELLRTRLDTDQILQHLTTGVLTVDSTGRVVFLNLAAQEVLELDESQICGRRCSEALPERLGLLRDGLLRAVRTGRPETRVQIDLRRRDGEELPVGCSTNVLLHQGAPTGVVAVFQDLREVREMERRALRNETLAAVGQLSAGIAHEIRNCLKPISGSVECLQRELKLEGENERLMHLIGRECDRLNRFVTELLSYSREREVVPEDIELGEAMEEVCELARRDPRCKPGTQVRTEKPGYPVHLSGDRAQLRQVWLNLAVNALEAMGERGSLTVRWCEGDRGEVSIEFIDDGSGIAAADLPRVGQPFFTTKQGGTGLGVAIAQRIVERHGGHLLLESAPARGTRARVILPSERIQSALAA